MASLPLPPPALPLGPWVSHLCLCCCFPAPPCRRPCLPLVHLPWVLARISDAPRVAGVGLGGATAQPLLLPSLPWVPSSILGTKVSFPHRDGWGPEAGGRERKRTQEGSRTYLRRTGSPSQFACRVPCSWVCLFGTEFSYFLTDRRGGHQPWGICATAGSVVSALQLLAQLPYSSLCGRCVDEQTGLGLIETSPQPQAETGGAGSKAGQLSGGICRGPSTQVWPSGLRPGKELSAHGAGRREAVLTAQGEQLQGSASTDRAGMRLPFHRGPQARGHGGSPMEPGELFPNNYQSLQ